MSRLGATRVKEEVSDPDEEDGKSIASVFDKKKQKPANKHVDPKSHSGAKMLSNGVKREEDGEESTPKKSAIKTVVTNKKVVRSKLVKEEVVVTKQVKKEGHGEETKDVKKRERKVYALPGQKRDPPEERDPLRIFYETLHQQLPSSEMAAIWMMESGLLPFEEARKVYERKQNKPQKLNSPSATVEKRKQCSSVTKKSVEPTRKTITVDSKTEASSTQSRKRKSKEELSEEEDDDDFFLSARKPKKSRAS